MDWYKHSTASHDDPDISDAMDEFGHAGYSAFFIILEIYGDEFNHVDSDGWLKLSQRFLARKLRLSLTKVQQILSFYSDRKRILVKIDNRYTFINCPKFVDIASNWTKRKVPKPTEDLQSPSVAPTAIEVEEEVEEEKRVSNDTLPSSPGKSNGIPSQEIITLYHEILPGLPRVKVWNESRKRKLKARWTEDKARQNLEWWREYFETVRGSPFLMGDRKEFKADFEWLIEAGNLPKVAEGRYKNGSQQGAMRI